MASVTFPTDLGGSGATISDDNDPSTGLANGGHRLRFIPALQGTIDMASYVYQYADKIDNAAADADRAENARGYVEAVADQYEVNILEQFSQKATLDLDFARGIYRVDNGTLTETTDFSVIGNVDRSSVKYTSDKQKNQQSVAIDTLSREVSLSGSSYGVFENLSTNISAGLITGGDATLTDSGFAFTDSENWKIVDGATDITTPSGIRSNVKPNIHSDVLADTESTYSIYFRGLDLGATEIGVRYFAGDNEITEIRNINPNETIKVEVNAPANATTFTPAIRIRALGGDTRVLMAGSQLEEKSSSTSYTPALVSATTRSADVCKVAGYKPAVNGSSIFIDCKGVYVDEISSNRYLFALTDGTTGNFIGVFARKSSSGDIIIRAFASESTLVSISVQEGTRIKAVLIFDNYNYYFYVNGAFVGSSFCDADSINALSEYDIANVAGSNQPLRVEFNRVLEVPLKITGAEAIALTTTGA